MNENLFVVTTDWHVTSSDAEAGDPGGTKPSQALAVSEYIRDTLDPVGVLDMGDCKHNFGADTGDELDNYTTNVRATLPYAEIADSDGALLPILPGNHDEVLDYTDGTMPTGTDFSLFDARFWGAPYHWTVDWDAPRIRFIGFHSYIHHSQDHFKGAGHVDGDEVDWLEEQLDALPANWYAIPCSHFPANSAFGNQIRFVAGNYYTDTQANPLTDLLKQYSTSIACYLNGHRHANFTTNTKDGVRHFNMPAMSYTIGNAYGGFSPVTYDASARTLTLDYLYGPPHPGGYTRYAGFTPQVVQLPPLAPAHRRSRCARQRPVRGSQHSPARMASSAALCQAKAGAQLRPIRRSNPVRSSARRNQGVPG